MTPEIVGISLAQLAFGLVFILGAGIASIIHALKLERDLLVGTIRTFVQLFLLGYILRFIFDVQNAALVLAIFGFMILFAAWEIRGRVKEKQVAFFWREPTPCRPSVIRSSLWSCWWDQRQPAHYWLFTWCESCASVRVSACCFSLKIYKTCR